LTALGFSALFLPAGPTPSPDTDPIDLERALKGGYRKDTKKRDLLPVQYSLALLLLRMPII
jgi:hypothetical protein